MEKNITFPTDSKLLNKAREKLVKVAIKQGLKLRQTYVRKGKMCALNAGRYAHAKQFKRMGKEIHKTNYLPCENFSYQEQKSFSEKHQEAFQTISETYEKKLTSLNLSYNRIGSAGSTSVSALTILTWLDLDDNKIGAAGATSLIKLKSLNYLYIRRNQISKTVILLLKKELKTTQISYE